MTSVQIGGPAPVSKTVNLPSLGGESQIQAANSSGVAVGTCQDKTKSNNFVATLWEPEGTNPVSPTSKWMVARLQGLSNSVFCEAMGVNEDGVAVGQCRTNNNSLPQAVRWDTNGTIAKLSDIASNSTLKFMQAYSINSSGQIVGQALGSKGFTAFFLDTNGTATDLGALMSSPFSSANAINDSGVIVGQASINGKSHAFLSMGGTNFDLGTLTGDASSTAEKINSAGVVIGQSSSTNGISHAVLWDTNGMLHDLNALAPNSKLVYTDATAIDDSGDIFVKAHNAGNAQFGALLIYAQPPMVTNQPTNLTVAVGKTASFNVSVSGTPPFKYQWFLNGNKKIPGAIKHTYTIPKVTLKNAGSYSVTVSNVLGGVTSLPAVLTVTSP